LANALKRLASLRIVHRDINPTNILIHRGTGGPVVRLVGFDRAVQLGDPDADTPPSLDRTPYQAPEAGTGHGAGLAEDVYSFGACLHFARHGTKPGAGPREQVLDSTRRKLGRKMWKVQKVIGNVSGLLDHVSKVCMRAQPNRRWDALEKLPKKLAILEHIVKKS
jgi:serine/threonine protein kinase